MVRRVASLVAAIVALAAIPVFASPDQCKDVLKDSTKATAVWKNDVFLRQVLYSHMSRMSAEDAATKKSLGLDVLWQRQCLGLEQTRTM
jgi:hypothetical protein